MAGMDVFREPVDYKLGLDIHPVSLWWRGRIDRRVQAGYPDFVREAPAAGCAYHIVYVNGLKVRYFGRDGDEHIQVLPGAARQG